MKSNLVLIGWLVAQTTLPLFSVCAQEARFPAADPERAASLAAQADDLLRDASSLREYQQAAGLLDQAVLYNPTNFDIQFKLGWVYLDKLHEPQLAYPHLAIAAKGHPDDANTRKLFGLACSQTGRMGQAVAEFRAASSLKPDDLWVRANLARSLARTGHWSQADKMYQEVLVVDPNNEDARLGEAELEAWRGHSTRPLQTLAEIISQDPTNVEAHVLMGDIHRWNWDLKEARQDYQLAMDVNPDAYGAATGQREAGHMASPFFTFKAYQFTDDTDFGRSSAGVDARLPLSDHTYLIGGADGWRFTNPGFEKLYRIDGHLGLEQHWNRWLETQLEGDSFNQVRYLGHETSFYGGQLTAKISPATGSDIYLGGALNQPFISSMPTVTNALKDSSVGGGLDVKIAGPLSIQDSFQWARISDGNHWWEEKPQVSLQVLHHPSTFLRAQFDYLSYAQAKTNYFSPPHYRTLAPVLATSLPLGTFFHFDLEGGAPYVFDDGKFGSQLDGGPVFDLGRHVQIKGTGYYSHIPLSQVTWSGHGWQAYLRIFF